MSEKSSAFPRTKVRVLARNSDSLETYFISGWLSSTPSSQSPLRVRISTNRERSAQYEIPERGGRTGAMTPSTSYIDAIWLLGLSKVRIQADNSVTSSFLEKFEFRLIIQLRHLF